MARSEADIERMVDAAVQRRLNTDRAYLHAENADEQRQREDEIEHEEYARITGHEWQRARFTGTVTCARCGLLPLDEDDAATECSGR
jgi:hypothetical protein